MANFLVLHQSYDDRPEICRDFRAFINQGMNPDSAKLKKRKFFIDDTEESSLPAAKHKCCEAAIASEEDSLLTTLLDSENVSCDMDVLDTLVDSAHDSNSFPGDSQLSPEVKFDTISGKIDSYDEVSTSWSSSALAKSLCGSFYSESKILSCIEDGKEDMLLAGGEKDPCADIGWDDNDFLDECISEEHFNDNKQQRIEGIEEFLSCSGMNPNLYAHFSERWSDDQEAQLGRRKPTIDQEFEQYFSTLML